MRGVFIDLFSIFTILKIDLNKGELCSLRIMLLLFVGLEHQISVPSLKLRQMATLGKKMVDRICVEKGLCSCRRWE